MPRSASLAFVGLTLIVTGCTTSGAAKPGTSTSVTSSTRAAGTTTTTTTPPAPVAVEGTLVPGEAFLGQVKRVAVVAVPAGRVAAPLPAVGAPGYLSIQRVAFRRFGSGPDLLLVMGQDGSMAWWEPSLLSALAQHYRVTIFDFPGVGYSDPPLSNVTLDWLADETAGLIQALSLVHPTVLGWGLGGEVALALAERHPASQGSLVLVDSSAGGPDATRPTVSVSAALDSDSATADSLASTFFAASSAADGSASGPSESASILPVAPVTAWLAAVDSSVPDNLTEAALADERTVQLGVWSSDALVLGSAAVAVPTLVVFGSDDVVFPTHDDVLLRRSIAASQLVILRNAGYASMFQDSSQFVSSLERFTG